MQSIKRICIALLVSSAIAQEVSQQEIPAAACTVYVLLEKIQKTEGSLWSVQSAAGFTVRDLRENRSGTVEHNELSIEIRNGTLHINGRRSPRQVRIDAIEGDLRVGDRSYTGSLYVLCQENSWYLVNGVDLEDYVYSVLGSESWPGWSLEVNKVLAIVLRSYVIAKRIESRGKKRLGKGFLYDVLNTNAHQTYRGLHTNATLRRAVDETRGMVLTHNKKPILAMYDTCCGGIIPADVQGVDFGSAPYLARSYACTFCEKSFVYSWSIKYTLADMLALLQQVDNRIYAIHQIHIAKTDKAGLVHEISVKSGKRTVKVSGKKAYSLFKDIKSYCFSVSKEKESFVIEGYGYGHHLGLCQWGACELAKRGWDCTSVLKFYYPGTQVMKLLVSN